MNHIDNLKLELGDKLHFDDGTVWQITSFDEDEDMIGVRRVGDHDAVTLGTDTDSWTAESIEAALVQGEAQTDDGRSHELVKHF